MQTKQHHKLVYKHGFVLYGTHLKLAKAEKINICLNGRVIRQSESYEYLGVTIDKCLTMNEHLEKD